MSKLEEYVELMARRYAQQTDDLTTEQFEEALRQALQSGDFCRHVMVVEGVPRQAVDYVPYRREQTHRALKDCVERMLAAHEDSSDNAFYEALEEAGNLIGWEKD